RSAKWCRVHADPSHVNVRANRKCAHQGCTTRPAYGVPGSGKSQFCKPHASENMVDVSIRTCAQVGCPKRATHGKEGIDDSKSAPFCVHHAQEGMQDVVSKRCAFQGCPVRNPRFGVPGSRRNVSFC
ncbi:unnamed protein product, partial [Hapterophycus canaliculatus]